VATGSPLLVVAGPTVMVIFGASGDLTQRKLMPALYDLDKQGFLNEHFTVIGVARTEMSDDDFRKRMIDAVPDGGDVWTKRASTFRYVAGEYGDPVLFESLKSVTGEVDSQFGLAPGTGSRLFYFAAPPSTFPLIVNGLAAGGLNKPGGPDSYARIVVEKPFGHDGASAKALDDTIHAGFDESQVFRIDHYLGKETVQNILALRFANTIFEPLWNRTYVDHLEITVAESIGVGHRGGFYEEAGAMRDIVQNHVLQVLALTLMEPPVRIDAGSIRDEKVKALKAIERFDVSQVTRQVVRGQYMGGMVDGEQVVGYRHEEGVSATSDTETFIAMRMMCDNWRWAGVPIFVRTGKRLAKRVTEITAHFRAAPLQPFVQAMGSLHEPNSLTVRIQPMPGISIRFGAKVPGQAFRVRTAHMDFDYDQQFPEEDLDGYERLLLDAMQGDATLFIRSDEVAVAWEIADPILDGFAQGDVPVSLYPAGTWGPSESDVLLDLENRRWRNP
jgi:glucose-6-phosphate 1-dehydrogenase